MTETRFRVTPRLRAALGATYSAHKTEKALKSSLEGTRTLLKSRLTIRIAGDGAVRSTAGSSQERGRPVTQRRSGDYAQS
jgi:hypothetical protein